MSAPHQPSSSRRDFLVGGLLIGTAAATGLLTRATPASAVSTGDLKRQVPAQIGSWRHEPASGVVIPQGEADGDEVYDQLVSRHYVSPSLPTVMLLVALGNAQSGSTQLHRPEVCYPSAGFRITEHGDVALPTPGQDVLQGRHLTGEAPGRTEQILYWTRIGMDFPTSNLAQRWSILRQTLSSGAPDGVLVRLSTIDPDVRAGAELLRLFLASLMQASDPPLRRLLWGAA